ncbi:hypothetical protein RJ641_022918, partial [Dillenia turbinata]
MESEEEKAESGKKSMEGVASIVLLPCGSISDHFIQLLNSICYSLHGTEITCERECSRGEDYCLIKLKIIDLNTNRDQAVVVECKGHDAARFHNIEHSHGQEYKLSPSQLYVTCVTAGRKMLWGWLSKGARREILVSFECETLKADKTAEDHIKEYMPELAGLDAI